MATTALASDERDLLARAHGEAERLHGPLGLSLAEASARILERVHAGWRELGLEPTSARVSEALARSALVDLVVATACSAGQERAWEALTRDLRPRLEGLALRRGAPPAEAEQLANDVLADLALPASKRSSEPLIATFDGAGSLFGWLAVILVRRQGTRATARREASLESLGGAEAESARSAGRRVGPGDPARRAEDAETATRFSGALTRAWARLSAQERLALVWKHRDGRSQREVGRDLGVTESRVSRIVSHAVAVLEEEAQQCLSGGVQGAPPWEALAQALERHWSSPEALRALPSTDRRSARAAPAATSEGRHAT